jgi:hypothetical protein
MNFYPKRIFVLLLAAGGCAAPVGFAGIFDLNRLVEDVVKDMINHKQNQQSTNHEPQAVSTNSNRLQRFPEEDSRNVVIRTAPRVIRCTLPATFSLPANVEWYDTGIVLSAGEGVAITAVGDIYVGDVPDLRLNYETADGSGIETTSDPQFTTPFVAPGLVPWSLVGMIGTNGQPFQAGSRITIVPQTSGELYLSVNANNFAANSGNWVVTIDAVNKPGHTVQAQVQTNRGSNSTQAFPPARSSAEPLTITVATNPPALLPPPTATTPASPK